MLKVGDAVVILCSKHDSGHLFIGEYASHTASKGFTTPLIAKIFSIRDDGNYWLEIDPAQYPSTSAYFRTSPFNASRSNYHDNIFLTTPGMRYWYCDPVLLKIAENYKPPVPKKIICRACGLKFEWILGTSKKAFVCTSCRPGF